MSTQTVSAIKAARLREQMERAFPWAMVTGYEPIVASMPNHVKDRHVVAVAVQAGAQVIATTNIKNFKPIPSGIEAQTADVFLCNLFNLDSSALIAVLVEQAEDLRNPPVSLTDLLAHLARHVPRFVGRVREHIWAVEALALPRRDPSSSGCS